MLINFYDENDNMYIIEILILMNYIYIDRLIYCNDILIR